MSRQLALIIGNSEYDDQHLGQLSTPEADVAGLAQVLENPEIGGFESVVWMLNETASVVRREISRFLTHRKQRDDLLLLYFSGHGVLDEQGRLYLAARDTEKDLLQATAVSAAFIEEELDRSHSRRQVFILDCCHSGAFTRGTKGAVGSSVGTKNAFAGNGYGRVVLTAIDATQYAWEDEELQGQAETSVFTHYLIQGLETGKVEVSFLDEAVSEGEAVGPESPGDRGSLDGPTERPQTVQRTFLRSLLVERFSLSELHDLSFDLGVDFENLHGDTKADKARGLMEHLERRGRLQELLDVGARQRPDIDWRQFDGLDDLDHPVAD